MRLLASSLSGAPRLSSLPLRLCHRTHLPPAPVRGRRSPRRWRLAAGLSLRVLLARR